MICVSKSLNYSKSLPINKNIRFINKLFKSGHYITLYTARYMGRNKNDVKKAMAQGLNQTKNQLNKWGLKYHKLFFGKPAADYYVDDKFIDFKKDWTKKISKILKNSKLC